MLFRKVHGPIKDVCERFAEVVQYKLDFLPEIYNLLLIVWRKIPLASKEPPVRKKLSSTAPPFPSVLHYKNIT